jgi:hypothetical protein
MPDLCVKSVGTDGLALLYPLIRSAAHVPLERWLKFAREILRTGGGVLAVTAPDNCVHGVAAYRRRDGLRHEQVLDVEIMAAFDLRADDRIRTALCEALERIGAELGCTAVHFTVPGKNAEPCSRGRSGLERLGLTLNTAGFARELPDVEGRQARK